MLFSIPENNPIFLEILEKHRTNLQGIGLGINAYDMLPRDMRKSVRAIVEDCAKAKIGNVEEVQKWLEFVDTF